MSQRVSFDTAGNEQTGERRKKFVRSKSHLLRCSDGSLRRLPGLDQRDGHTLELVLATHENTKHVREHLSVSDTCNLPDTSKMALRCLSVFRSSVFRRFKRCRRFMSLVQFVCTGCGGDNGCGSVWTTVNGPLSMDH